MTRTANPYITTPASARNSTLPSGIQSRAWKLQLIRLQLFVSLFRQSLPFAKSPWRALRWMKTLQQKHQAIHGNQMGSKMAEVDGKYYWHLGAAGFPSPAFARFWKNELNREFNFHPQTSKGVRNVYFAITKKCPYQCEHCFEWGNLNKPETLKQQDIQEIVEKFQDFGSAQIIFSGGEPLLRIKDILAVLPKAHLDTDFWVFSSGFSLNAAKAHQLKASGLTGIIISLDHWLPDAHDRFRGYPGAFSSAATAITVAREAGLVTGLSLCVTRDFCTRENLDKYLDMAKNWGVPFVQFLEPIAVGHFQGEEVMLNTDQLALLERYYQTYNRNPRYRDYPIIDYAGYHQRRVGCFGSGNRFLYIDTDGDIHRCPFCQEKVANALAFPISDVIDLLQQKGCGLHAGSTL